MKKLLSLAAALLSLSTLSAQSFVPLQPATLSDIGFQIVSLPAFNEEMLEDFFTGQSPNIILECSQGMALPFRLNVGGEFLSLKQPENKPYQLEVVKTFYTICLDEDLFLFSNDLEDWREFEDFFTGLVGITLNEGDVQGININVELNKRLSN